MEIKAQIEYTNDKERMDFIVEYNHRQGYDIRYSTRTETVERTREVLEFETVTESEQRPLLDSEGEIVLDENNEPVMETVEVEVEKPVMLEETYTEFEPQYDNEGNFTEEIEVEKTHLVQKAHIETYEEDVTINIVEAWGYTEEEKQEQERARINKLTCTKRVFALMLQELGVSYTQLKELIATNERAQLEWDLCVELERSNPLLDVMAGELGVTSEQLDEMFIRANL